jgi:serine/threonine protein kinase
MAICYHYSEFEKMYQIDKLIGQGTYGKVYLTDDEKYVVKKQKLESLDFIKEICILSQYNHPNVCPILAISFLSEDGYIAMDRGERLYDAYRSNKITLREIVTDLMSVFAFFYVNGVLHGDLKAANIVYHQGKAKVIDFGLGRFCKFNTIDGQDEFTTLGLSYTPCFDDPEYIRENEHSIKTELYSIVSTIYYMLKNEYHMNEKRPFYISRNNFESVGIDDENLIDLLLQCQNFITERKSPVELLSHPAIISERVIEPIKLKPETYVVKDIISNQPNLNEKTLPVLIEWMKDSTSKIPHVVFLAVDIMYRYISKENVKIEIKDLLLIGGISIMIAANLFGILLTLRNIKRLISNSHEIEQIEEKFCRFYTLLKGNFWSYTIFDTIPEDEIDRRNQNLMILTMCNKFYDSSKIYSLEQFPKRLLNIDIRDYRTFFHLQLEPISDFELVSGLSFTTTTTLDDFTIGPNEDIHKYYKKIIYYAIKNRHTLHTLDAERAFKLFMILYENYINSESDILMKRLLKWDIEMVDLDILNTYKSTFNNENIFGMNNQKMYDIINQELEPLENISDQSPNDIIESIYNGDDLLVKLTELHRASKGLNVKYETYINDEHVLILASSRSMAVIKALNIMREKEADYWEKQIPNLTTFTNLDDWVYSWFSNYQEFNLVAI